MSATDALIERNADRREELSQRAFTISPGLRALVLACADHRADPAHVLGLDLGEAVIMRNPGGRVTPAFIQDVMVLSMIAVAEGLKPGFELIVMHHTDCGLTRLNGPEHSRLVARYFRVPESEIPAKHLTDPRASVRADLDLLRSHPLIPRTLIASGIVYDIKSGRAEVVCPPARLGGQS